MGVDEEARRHRLAAGDPGRLGPKRRTSMLVTRRAQTVVGGETTACPTVAPFCLGDAPGGARAQPARVGTYGVAAATMALATADVRSSEGVWSWMARGARKCGAHSRRRCRSRCSRRRPRRQSRRAGVGDPHASHAAAAVVVPHRGGKAKGRRLQ